MSKTVRFKTRLTYHRLLAASRLVQSRWLWYHLTACLSVILASV